METEQEMIRSDFSKTENQAEMLANRLRKRQRHLKKWARRTGAGMYRLYDRDIPEIPLVMDWYCPIKDNTSVTSAALTGALYKRPYEKENETAWLAAMKEAAASALDIEPEMIFLKERKQQKGDLQYKRFDHKEIRRKVYEAGLCFWVNLSDYLDTGLFPDRRLFRSLLYHESGSLRILNLFCYTASLSVAAAAGGAAAVDSVDLSNNYLAWAKENFSLNYLDAGFIKKEEYFNQNNAKPFTLIRDDVLRFTEEARRCRLRWDIIILDPPAFSNSKKMYKDFDLKRDHPALITDCLELLNPGGKIYLNANVKGFKLNLNPANQKEKLSAADITEQLRDEDFTGKHIPRAWRISKTF
ncbi:MAG: class I SAM-dependent methyltransferase [Treponema sp.]|nr:class I SAM-dependent methyltransferase [Treponema sp.]